MPVGIEKIVPIGTNLQADTEVIEIPVNGSLNMIAKLYKETKNVRATDKSIKWVLIKAEHLPKLRAMRKEEPLTQWERWRNIEKIPISHYGIGIHYANTKEVNVSNLTSKRKDLIGTLYWLEAFIYYPEFKYPTGKYIVVKDKPQIRHAFFEGTGIGKKYNLVKSIYGKSIDLIVGCHLLPNLRVNYHNYVVFEVDIYNVEKNIKVTTTPFRSVVDFAEGSIELNTTIRINIIIDESWKDKTAHKKEETRQYYAEIKAIQYTNTDAVFEGETKTINGGMYAEGAKFSSVSPNGELIAVEVEAEDWKPVNWIQKYLGRGDENVMNSALRYQRKEIVFKTTDSHYSYARPTLIQLPFTTLGEAIEIRNIEAGNTAAEVRIQKRTCKAYNPCKFTSINVSVGKNKPVEVFNEDCKIPAGDIESFNKSFNLKAGSTKKENVTITLEKLSITDFGNESGKIKCISETPHKLENLIAQDKVSPQWLENKVDKTNENHSTYEVKNNTILLEMSYLYDTNVAENSFYSNEILDKLWMFNYFLLSKDQMQKYVIPISTCRYPNQFVAIQVYPDITWGITFSIGKADSKYKEEWRKDLSEARKKTIDEGKAFNKKSELDYLLTKKEKALKKLKLSLGINASYNNEKIDFTPDLGNKINDFLYTFAYAKECLDELTGNKDDEPTKQKKYQKRIKELGGKWADKLTKLPISISVSEPALSFGGTWGWDKYEKDKTILAPTYNIFFKASPLLEASGKLDLITCAEFVPAAGQIIKVVDFLLATAGVEASFFIEVKGSINVGYDFKMQVDDHRTLSKGDSVGIESSLKVKVEAGITIEGGLQGFFFSDGDGDYSGTTKTEYSANAETGFKGVFKVGADYKGLYIDAKIEFSGLKAVAQKKETESKFGTSKTKKLGAYTIVEKYTLLGDKYYFNLDQHENN